MRSWTTCALGGPSGPGAHALMQSSTLDWPEGAYRAETRIGDYQLNEQHIYVDVLQLCTAAVTDCGVCLRSTVTPARRDLDLAHTVRL